MSVRAALAPESVEAEHFDGLSARARRVRLRIAGAQLHIQAEQGTLQVPLEDVLWPERTRHGARVAHLHAGGSLQALDAAQWDAWARTFGPGESLVVKAQQNWRATALALALLLALGAAGYRWGVPWMARGVLAVLPPAADRAIGDAALASLGQGWLQPSRLPAARQAALRDGFARAVERAYSAGARPAYELRFLAGGRSGLGPNAFALPGGSIVLTDEMVQLLDGRDDVLFGVLAHELGHVRLRHGVRQLLQVTLLGAASSVALGDFSTLAAAAPALLGRQGYSRELEREADRESIGLLRANGLRPSVMLELFRRLASEDGGKPARSDLGIALASHPADAQRMRTFREADED